MPITTYSAGEVLTAASLNSNFAATGLQFVKSQTIGSGVSSVEVTGAFSADYDAYKILVSGGASSADTVLNLTLGATATGYYWVTQIVTWGSPQATNLTGGSNDSKIGYVGGTSTTSLVGDFTIINPYLSENTFVIADCVFDGDNGGGWTRGYANNTTSYTAFTLAVASGTITGGTIRVYGYTN